MWGQELIVHTDHMNIIYGNLSNDRIIRWRLLLEECNPTYVHIKGKDNIVADALSWLDADFNEIEISEEANAQMCACTMTLLDADESYEMPETNIMEAMAQTFGKSKKERKLDAFPMSPTLIGKEKQSKTKRHQIEENS